MAEKYKSKLREKLAAASKRDEANEAGGRTLSYGNAATRYKDNKVTVPKKKRGALVSTLKDKVIAKAKTATQDHAKKVLSGGLKGDIDEATKGLLGIRHPGQLIPAIKAGGTLSAIIKAFMK